ncbi:MAG: AAA family ATPase [Saprospiraceae bacterium]|nr:AAA family ATPase [Saprospiraceae bacterium]
MKILTLSFKNIHSLKGEHKIDFASPPLSNAGLFAITGPTGAGKSTLLDIITLALFSRIPRFNEKVTNTEIEKIGSVITHFTDDAYAEIEYRSNDKIFRSTWRIARTRTGNLKDYEMTLAELPEGKYLDLKKSEVPATNEKIIGLNYEQFIRSILLSQGEFAKFLRSDEKERAKLLEDITGSHIYRTLGKAAFEKAKQKREEIQLLKQQIAFVPVLNDDQIIEKKNVAAEYKSRIQDIITSLADKIKLSTLLEKKQNILQKIDLSKKSYIDLEEKKVRFKPLALKLDKHQRLDFYRGELSLSNNENIRLATIEKELGRLEGSIKDQELALIQAIKDMADFTHQDISESNFMSEMSKFQQIIVQYDNILSKAKEDGIHWRNRINEILKKSDNTLIINIKGINSTAEQLAYAEKNKESLNRQKAKNKLSDSELNEKIEKLQQDIIQLSQQKSEIKRKEETTEEILTIRTDIKILRETKISLTERSGFLAKEIELLGAEIIKLQQEKENHLKIASLDDHRHNLLEGEPCPLCGSIDHPYAHQLKLINLGKEALELYQKLEKNEAFKTSLMALHTQIASGDAKVETLSQQLILKESVINKINESLQDPEGKLSYEHISDALEKTKTKLTMLYEAKEAQILENIFAELILAYKELISIGQKYSETFEHKAKLYNGTNVHADADKIQNTYTASNSLMKELTVTYKNQVKTKEELVQSIEARKLILMPNLLKIGYKSISEANQDILADDVLQKLVLEKDALIRTETEIRTTLQNLQKELSDIDEVDVTNSDLTLIKTEIQQLNIEKDSINNNIGAIEKELEKNIEANTLIEKTKKILKVKEMDASVWFIMDHLIGDATGNKYAKYAQNLSLQHLIILTNRRLTKLSDRYLLSSNAIEEDLRVIDLYQGNITRSVKTLSGGESFIVSLALALSLSDMASKNVKLESLFIDEGFGTLDAETLETALTTLEKLQSESNRMIGIISHVDSLKERISTQIQVVKNNLGYATINITG